MKPVDQVKPLEFVGGPADGTPFQLPMFLGVRRVGQGFEICQIQAVPQNIYMAPINAIAWAIYGLQDGAYCFRGWQ